MSLPVFNSSKTGGATLGAGASFAAIVGAGFSDCFDVLGVGALADFALAGLTAFVAFVSVLAVGVAGGVFWALARVKTDETMRYESKPKQKERLTMAMPTPDCVYTPFYQSCLLAPYSEYVIHGFTGKPFSYGGPDTSANPRPRVLENRKQLLSSITSNASEWLIPEQVHGHRVGQTGDCQFLKTDAIALITPEKPVMLLFADCVPIMLYEPDRHVGAVIHAGWRGTAQAIAQEAVLTLQNKANASPSGMIAVIGPCISVCCFQVSMPVAEALADAIGLTVEAMADQGFLQWDEAYPQNPRMDLKAINQYQLQQAGITQIEVAPACTRCDEANLFSFRRGEDGRNSAYLLLKDKSLNSY